MQRETWEGLEGTSIKKDTGAAVHGRAITLFFIVRCWRSMNLLLAGQLHVSGQTIYVLTWTIEHMLDQVQNLGQCLIT